MYWHFSAWGVCQQRCDVWSWINASCTYICIVMRFPCDLSFLVVVISTTFGDCAYLVCGTHTLWQASLWHLHGLIPPSGVRSNETAATNELCITCMHNVSIVLVNDRPYFDATCWGAVKRLRGGRTAAQGMTTLPYAGSLRSAPAGMDDKVT